MWRSLTRFGIALLFCAPSVLRAEDLKVLAPLPVKKLLEQAVAQYQGQHPGSIAVDVRSGQQVVASVKAGETYDVVISAPNFISQLADGGFVGNGIVIAEGRAVLAYRKGAPTPDASTPDKLRDLVLSAKAISISDPALGGSTSTFFVGFARETGIEDKIRGKMVLTPNGRGAEPVDKGDAEIGISQMSELVSLPNVSATPLLPNDPKTKTQFVAAVSSHSKQPRTAQEFINFLASSETSKIKEAQGLQ